jgi:MFS family permease
MEPNRLPPNYHWNFAALMMGWISFSTALTFINISTVMPALAGQLTDSAPLIGLIGTIISGGWLLPQLVVARLIRQKPRMKPYILMGAAGRVALVVIAAALCAGLARYPGPMLALYYGCILLFIATDAITSIPWFEFLARAIPPRQRGRLIGLSQVFSGIAGIGVGALVGVIVGSPRLGFPDNYALLFALAAVSLIPSTVALASLREAPARPISPQTSDRGRAGWLADVMRDPAFRGAIICRVLVSMIELATPFYVGHASEVLRLPERVLGGFVVAQTVGSILAGATMGMLSERRGPRAVVRVGSAVVVIGPLFALLVHLRGGGLLGQGYALVFAVLGIVNSIGMLGFTNYLLAIAPQTMRMEYVGLANTITGVVTIAPTVGGWLLEATSYAVLFGLTAALVAAGFVVSLTLAPAEESGPPNQGVGTARGASAGNAVA